MNLFVLQPIRTFRYTAMVAVVAILATVLTATQAAQPASADPVPPSTLALVVDKPMIVAGESAKLTATTDVNVTLSSSIIEIKDETANVVLKSCTSGMTCAVLVTFATGGAHSYVATVGDLTSTEVTVERAPWEITLATNHASVNAGKVARLTATANQNVGRTSNAYNIFIFDDTAGVLLTTCLAGKVCRVDTPSLYADADHQHNYSAAVAAAGSPGTLLEAIDTQATSNQTSVQRNSWQVTISSSRTEIASGQSATVTAKANQDVGLTDDRYALYIFDVRNNTRLARCLSGKTCSGTSTWASTDEGGVYVAFIAAKGNPTSLGDLQQIQGSSSSASVDHQSWSILITGDSGPIAAGQQSTLLSATNQNLSKTSGRYATYIYEAVTNSIESICTTGMTCKAFSNFYEDSDDLYANRVYFALVADYNPAATSLDELTNVRAFSDSKEVYREQWEVTFSQVGGSTFTAETNQRLSYTNGRVAVYIIQSTDDGQPQRVIARCTSFTTCMGSGAAGDEAGYYAAVAAYNPSAIGPVTPEIIHEIDITTLATGTLPPAFGDAHGPSGNNESTGGCNPSLACCQCDHADPVNSATGEFHLATADLSIAGVGPQLAISRTYSSALSSSAGDFGKGWVSNLAPHILTVLKDPSSHTLPLLVRVVQENGGTVTFYKNADQTYDTQSRVKATLSYDRVGARWIFTRKSRDVLMFNRGGALTEVRDEQGNSVVYQMVDGKLSLIEASGGRTLSIEWSGDLIAAISDSAGRRVEYTYDSGANLISVVSADGSVTHYAYDAEHLLTGVTDPEGGVLLTTYGPDHKVSSQTDQVGNVTTFSYDGSRTTVAAPDGIVTIDTYVDGLLVEQARAAGTADEATTTYSYDQWSNVSSVTDPSGAVTLSTYDQDGNQLTKTDPLGRTTTWTYDSTRHPLSRVDPLGRITIWNYGQQGQLLSQTDPSGHTASWAYNADGTVSDAIDKSGAAMHFGYDVSGRINSATDADGRSYSLAYSLSGFVTSKSTPDGTTSYGVDELGRVTSVTNPANEKQTMTFDGNGRQTSVSNAEHETTAFAYDLSGALVQQTDPLGNVTQVKYDDANRPIKITRPDGSTVGLQYDGLGLVVESRDGLGEVTETEYDLAGRPTLTRTPRGAETATTYDAAGQIVAKVDPIGNETTYSYDAAGQLESVTDPIGRTTSYSYTPDGYLAQKTQADGSSEQYLTDALGRITSLTNADGGVTSYAYTTAGLVSSRTQPGGLTTTSTFDQLGRDATITLPDGSVTSSSYDAAGRLIRLSSSDSSTTPLTYSYDHAGRLTGTSDDTGSSSYSYDGGGRLTSETNGHGDTQTYTYDVVSRIATLTLPGSKTVEYSYDANGQMVSLTDWNGHETSFSWSHDGDLSSTLFANGVGESREFDLAGQLTGITFTHGSNPLGSFTYVYDAAGQLVTRNAALNSLTEESAFENDQLGHLGSATTSILGAPASVSDYASTSAGLLTVGRDNLALAYNSAQQVISATLAGGATTTFGYDANGSRVSSSAQAVGGSTAVATNYSYDGFGNLKSVSGADGGISYSTDARGLRESRTTAGVTKNLLWSSSRKIPLMTGDGDWLYVYGPGLTPVEQVNVTTGDTEYLQTDLLGSVSLVTDQSGAGIGETLYSEYGERVAHAGAADSAIGFTGNWTDSATGFVYLRARDYDPSTAQFISIDPVVGSTHQPYAYADNQPLVNVDPLGLFPWTTRNITVIIGLIADLVPVYGWAVSLGAAVSIFAQDAESFDYDLLGEDTLAIVSIGLARWIKAPETVKRALGKTGNVVNLGLDLKSAGELFLRVDLDDGTCTIYNVFGSGTPDEPPAHGSGAGGGGGGGGGL
jgi:RHS repeat-associated protein